MDSDLLQGVLNYVVYNEEDLAFEILCDHICECDVSIADEKYNEVAGLNLGVGLDLYEGLFKYLLGLKK